MLIAALEREAAAFCAVLGTAELTAQVSTCPGWDLTELAAHLAGTHRWARNAVVDGVLRRDPTPPLPDRSAVLDWYRSSADGLLDALRQSADDAPCPTFLSPDGTAAFWLRRQVHELAVHRYDAELAAGRDPVLDGEVSADGISEVLQVFLPRMRARGLLGDLPATVGLKRTDGPEMWLLGDDDDGDDGGDDDGPAAVVSATAQVLLLVLWKRIELDAAPAFVDGDADAARAVLSAALTP